ncbi:MAG: alkyl sulfatase dimerization domain-containing protein [Planctomycetota bacterium]|jgi:alkyl sulfatase BDS1-like metallo-beta-lactamase superfamily hydrolase
MKRGKAFKIIAVVVLTFAAVTQAEKSAPSSRYMGGPAELVKAPNGAIVNKEVLEELPKTAWTRGPEIENPVEGVYVLGGYLISACIVVEADDGLIVFDTGDTKKDGEKLLKAIRTFSDKPVKVIVYGHTHYCFGAGAMAEGNKDVMVIGHPDLNKIVQQNMSSGGAPAYFPEISPYLTARALQQFNVFLPDKGPDAWFSPTNLNIDEMAFLPVNRAPKDGEVLQVLGIRMQFFTRYGTDDKGHTTVWLPDRKICIENALWATPPNMYSIRGDLFRDAREWAALVKIVRDLKPEALIGYAHRPLVGKEKIRNTLTAYLDGIAFTLDQTLRHILGGYGPDDLRHMIKMPDYLAKDPHNFESYGELSFQTPAIYYHAVGWFDGDAATIFRPSPKEEAERLVKLIGGRDKVLQEAEDAYDRKEYAWAAQLVNYLYKLNPQDKEARLFKAKVLRQLAYLSTGANARSHLLTTALALEGKIVVPRLIPPQAQYIAAAPENTVDYFRVRLDPKKSGDTDEVLVFDFQGNHKTVGLHIRRAVAEYLDDPDEHYKLADVALSLSGEAWAKLYLSQATVKELADSGQLEMKRGTIEEAEHLIDMFDKYRPEKAVLVAPHLHD